MILEVLIATAFVQEPRQYSGQCLAAVASRENIRLDFMDDASVARVRRVADDLWIVAAAAVDADIVALQLQDDRVLQVRAREQSGSVPAGSAEAEGNRLDGETIIRRADVRTRLRFLEPCNLPDYPNATRASLRAERDRRLANR